MKQTSFKNCTLNSRMRDRLTPEVRHTQRGSLQHPQGNVHLTYKVQGEKLNYGLTHGSLNAQQTPQQNGLDREHYLQIISGGRQNCRSLNIPARSTRYQLMGVNKLTEKDANKRKSRMDLTRRSIRNKQGTQEMFDNGRSVTLNLI